MISLQLKPPILNYDIYTLSMASEVSGIKYDTLYKRYLRGKLQAVKHGGILFISKAALGILIDGN